MLKRSKDASLIIEESGLSWYTHPGTKLAITHHGARIKHLSFLYQNSQSLRWGQSNLPMSAPRLESLCIQNGTPHGLQHYRLHSHTVSIVEHIQCKAERLRRLELVHCDIDWNSHSYLLHTLTHLKLDTLSETSRPTGQQFLDALHRMPRIEALFLKDALPIPTSNQASWASGHIHLTSLRTLKLCSTNIEIEPFFSCITFPSTATVEVVVHSIADAQVTSGIISNMARLYSDHSSANAFQTIVMAEPSTHYGFELNLYAEPLTNDEYINLTLRLGLVFHWPDLDFTLRGKIADTITNIFSSAIPLQHVEHVYMEEMMFGIDAETMANTIGELPRVFHVMAAHTSSATFLNALQLQTRSCRTAAGSVTPVETPSFASLSSVDLYRTAFFDPPLDSESVTVEMLQDCLIHRYECGVEIRRLTLVKCNGVTQADVDFLAEIVVDVDWDGVNMEEEDYEYSDAEGEFL
ncbi:hypothetical protein BJ912DRAFT_950985 [Pholiota molesta]|nr:hypothetical protein BJ912DRAFT_950985 [Pholiota molesta]